MGTHPSIILHEDKWIQQRVKEYCGKFPGHETTLSYFFWRIKPEGIQTMQSGQPLIFI
jgi:hypothetical protein